MTVQTQFNLLKSRLLSVKAFGCPAQFTKFLSLSIQDFDLKFRTTRSNNLEMDMIVFNGLYDPSEDKQMFPCIDVEVLYFTEQKMIETQNLDVDYILSELFETIFHEKVHQTQYRNRKFKAPKRYIGKTQDQTYLGCPDEIEAHAAEIAVDTHVKGLMNINEAIYNNKTYKMYVDTFGISHVVLDNLFEYSCKYFNKLQEQNHVLY